MRKITKMRSGSGVRTWATLALTLLALILVYSGFWVYGAMKAVGAAERWVGERQADGYTARYDSLRATGYPFWIRLELVNPHFGAPKSAMPWDWNGDNLAVSVRPWWSGRMQLRTSGGQIISYVTGGQRQTFVGTAKVASAELAVAGKISEAVSLTVRDLNLSAKQAGAGTGAAGKIAVANASIQLQRLQVAAGAEPDAATITFDGTASGIELPSSFASPLGHRIRDLRLAGRLLGELPRGPGVPLAEALEIWRDGGGTVEIDHLDLTHGPLGLRADGTLALDGDLQPIGAFTARVQGFFETIDAFSNIGLIGVREAVAAKLLLGVFSHRPKNGGPATLNLAVTVQQRELYAGPVKLLRIPFVQWR